MSPYYVHNNVNSSLRDINKLVERWNHRAKVNRICDCENYINGDIKFLFEYSGIRNIRRKKLTPIHRRDVPNHVPVVLAEAAIDKSSGEIWNLLDKHLTSVVRHK